MTETKPVDVLGGIRQGQQLRTLTSLRFAAVLLVFGAHVGLESSSAGKGAGTAADDFFDPGARFAISFFFALSGFVLTWTAGSGLPDDRRFWRARVAKVWPAHVLTALAAAVLMVTVTGVAPDPAATAANLFLLHAWIPDAGDVAGLNHPSWSLSCLAFFYLVFPLLLAAARRVRADLLWPAVLASTGVCALISLIGELLLPSPEQTWLLAWFPPTHLFEFVTGILVARIIMCGRWIHFGFASAVLLVAAGYALLATLPTSYALGAVTILPAALLIGAAAHADVTGASTWGLRSRVPVRLGELSFAFYLVHWLVVSFGHRVVGRDPSSVPGAVWLIAVALGISLGLSWVLHAGVERPFVRALGRGRRVAPPPQESAANWSQKNCE